MSFHKMSQGDDLATSTGRMTGKAGAIYGDFVRMWSRMLGRDLIFECNEEETNYITRPNDARLMYPAILGVSDESQSCFIDAFACVGGDTLAAMYYFKHLHMHAVQLNTPEFEGRFNRLTTNIRHFNRVVPGRTAGGYAYGMDINSFLSTHTEILLSSILYLDPPWTVDSSGTGISPVGEISAFLNVHVWQALEKSGMFPPLIILKLPVEAEDVQDWGFLNRYYSFAGKVSPRGRFYVHSFQRRRGD
jgi:hypothetical protein